MKKNLLMLIGVLLVSLTAAHAAAPASFLTFNVNGSEIAINFSQFSAAVPTPYNLGTITATSESTPDVALTGYQVVMYDGREGRELEVSHDMQVYVGVYDKSIIGTPYYDATNDGLYIVPSTQSTAVRFDHQYSSGTGPWNTNLGNMTVSQFVQTDGAIITSVLPKPLVYDALTNSYIEGTYQQDHSYVIVIHFKEIVQCTVDNASWTTFWHYPECSSWTGEYTSFVWADMTQECLVASFDYSSSTAVNEVKASGNNAPAAAVKSFKDGTFVIEDGINQFNAAGAQMR